MMRKLYANIEARFMSKYPDRFPGGTFGGELPNFIVKCDWAQGTPWNDPKTRSKDDTTHRKLLQIVMKIDDSERMIALTREIKKKGRDKDVFGEHAYLATQPSRGAQQHEKQAWEKKVKFSGTVVMNMGSAEFNGLENPDAEVETNIFGEVNDGSGTWAVKPAGMTSARQLLTKMKGKDGRRFWQCLS